MKTTKKSYSMKGYKTYKSTPPPQATDDISLTGIIFVLICTGPLWLVMIAFWACFIWAILTGGYSPSNYLPQ